jgi:predicted nucleic acid-binding protein
VIVLDASAALARVLPSQRTAASHAFFNSDSLPHFIAPTIFAWEVRHALLKAERGGRASSDQANDGALALDGLAKRISWDDTSQSFARLVALARAENLSLFDAAYLDLAIAENASLASRDVGLIEAAKRRRVKVVDLR